MATKERFKEWYKENKEKLAQQRKERYYSDPEYREKRIKDSKRYYWMNKRRAVPLKKIGYDIDSFVPDEIADVIISNEEDIRCGINVPVPMFYHGSMSKYLKRTTQTLRLWALKGLIPESTYRNHLNYRIYTKDQLKVYLDNIHLLRLHVKDFPKHPFFEAIRKGLDELEPDGIEVMHISEWRFVEGERCSWCRSGTKLEYFDGKTWTEVPCFECLNPYDIESRLNTKEQKVVGHCDFCDKSVSDEMIVVRDLPILICPTCNRRIPDAKTIK